MLGYLEKRNVDIYNVVDSYRRVLNGVQLEEVLLPADQVVYNVVQKLERKAENYTLNRLKEHFSEDLVNVQPRYGGKS